jgi:hypothetical protein
LLLGDREEMESLQRVLESAPAYAERVTGNPSGPADAERLFSALPEGKSYSDKFLFGVYCADRMVDDPREAARLRERPKNGRRSPHGSPRFIPRI